MKEEIQAESRRLAELIRKASEPAIKAVAEMAKHPLTLEQMREQVRRQAAKGWNPTQIPQADKTD